MLLLWFFHFFDWLPREWICQGKTLAYIFKRWRTCTRELLKKVYESQVLQVYCSWSVCVNKLTNLTFFILLRFWSENGHTIVLTYQVSLYYLQSESNYYFLEKKNFCKTCFVRYSVLFIIVEGFILGEFRLFNCNQIYLK